LFGGELPPVKGVVRWVQFSGDRQKVRGEVVKKYATVRG